MTINSPAAGYGELLQNLVVRNLKSRYKDSLFGFLWSVLTPLFMALIYVVFLKILARGVPMEEVLIGIFAWQFTSQCVFNGMNSIAENSNLVKKVCFPRVILPLASTLSNLVNFLLTLIVQFLLVELLLLQNGEHISIYAMGLPVVVALHALFCFSIAVFLSCLHVFFRDIQHLINVLMTAWFFLTPAMYALPMVTEMARRLGKPGLLAVYMTNPMAGIITAYRAMILPSVAFPTQPEILTGVFISFVLSALFFTLALWMFRRLQPTFADMF